MHGKLGRPAAGPRRPRDVTCRLGWLTSGHRSSARRSRHTPGGRRRRGSHRGQCADRPGSQIKSSTRPAPLDHCDQNTLIRAIAEMPGFDLAVTQIGGSVCASECAGCSCLLGSDCRSVSSRGLSSIRRRPCWFYGLLAGVPGGAVSGGGTGTSCWGLVGGPVPSGPGSPAGGRGAASRPVRPRRRQRGYHAGRAPARSMTPVLTCARGCGGDMARPQETRACQGLCADGFG